MRAGVVEIHRDGDEYRVECNPPHPVHPAQWSDKREAWGIVGGIRLITDRVKVDLTGEYA